ncbi:sigma-70 family RNA polymerase sigma factor [Acidithiobacillus caldus]
MDTFSLKMYGLGSDKVNDRDVGRYLRALHPMILRVAKRIQDTLPVDHLDDLVQTGVTVAWEHYEHHLRHSDPESFRRWLFVRIRGAMLDFLRDEDPFPRRLRDQSRKLERAAAQFRSREMREPSDRELAEAAGMDLDALHAHFIAASRAAPDYLEDYLMDGVELAAEPGQAGPDVHAVRQEWAVILERAIDRLQENERVALSLYILEGLTLEEVAEVLGCGSKSSALRVVNAAIFKCRSYLAEQSLSLVDF